MLNGLHQEQVQHLAMACRAEHDQIAGVLTAIEHAIEQLWWAGPDADRFRAEWSAELRPVLATAATQLGDAARHLGRQLIDQINASNS